MARLVEKMDVHGPCAGTGLAVLMIADRHFIFFGGGGYLLICGGKLSVG